MVKSIDEILESLEPEDREIIKEKLSREKHIKKYLEKKQYFDEILLDSLPHPAMIINRQRQIIASNRIAREIGAQIGGYCWKDFGHSTSLDKNTLERVKNDKTGSYDGVCCTFCLADIALDSLSPQRNSEVRVGNKIFDTYWIPLKHDDLFLHYAIDITKFKQIDKVIIQSERLSAIGELASGVAHDFNNSLQVILGNIELAMLEDSSLVVRNYFETIKKSASDAASRVQQLQRFAGKRTKSLEYEVLNIDIVVNNAIAQTKNIWKDEAEKKGLSIAVNTDYGNDISINGNLGQLKSVISNLIKNSIEAMPKGGTIDITTRKDDQQVYLTITDSGEGMTEETKMKIFQPFYTTKRFKQGTGLGMSASYSTIQEHKGDIYIKKTELGKGTTIEICLPYAKIKTDPKKVITQEFESSARVLYVDDEEGIRKLGEKIITRLGHDVDTASDGNKALKLLATNEYDLMITDIGMPGMSGWQLTKQIKGKYSGMKVAVVSGWGADVKPWQKEKYGIGYVFGKPIKINQIKSLISQVLQMKRK